MKGKGQEQKTDSRITRKTFLKIAAASLGAGLLGAGGCLLLSGPGEVRMERHILPVPNLPKSWAGRKIVQVSDTHSSPASGGFLRQTFDRINEERPDVIAFTGDYAAEGRDLQKSLAIVAREGKRLKASIPGGKLAVLGNHDRWAGERDVIRALEEAGFNVLVNGSVRLGESPGLVILGLDDLWSGTVDYRKTLAGVDLSRDAAVALSHNPDVLPDAGREGIRVILAGHTHGGQVVLPFFGPPYQPSKYNYVCGFFRHGKSILYVSRGLGCLFPPFRLNCPPEVAVFTLARG